MSKFFALFTQGPVGKAIGKALQAKIATAEDSFVSGQKDLAQQFKAAEEALLAQIAANLVKELFNE